MDTRKNIVRNAEYVNISPDTIKVVGADGKIDTIAAGAKVIRSDWYNRYVPKYLKLIRYTNKNEKPRSSSFNKINSPFKPNLREARRIPAQARPSGINPSQMRPKIEKTITRPLRKEKGKTVGKQVSNPAAAYREAKTTNPIHISNNIGIGILSYNRIDCLRRLVNSIRAHTDLSKTTIFISDESDSISQEDSNWLNSLQDIVVIRNNRIGIAGNSNRLLHCLSRFKYKILLNDDVEILNDGWEHFYVDAMNKSGIKHFCYRQVGVYGAQVGSRIKIKNFELNVIHEKPHGAVMFFDDNIFKEVGFFDESFGFYGMEHVDWSERASLVQNQSGFFDVPGSDRFFKIHSEATSSSNKAEYLNKAKQLYSKVKGTRKYVHASNSSNVDGISVIIPFQGNDRLDDIVTVVNNMRAMKCPNVEIVLVEQDFNQKINQETLEPINYKFIRKNGIFNKSAAFNFGAKSARFNNLVLHDGDIVTKPTYLSEIVKTLKSHDACHLAERSDTAQRNAMSSLYGLQCWVALPERDEECAPDFTHLKAGQLPVAEGEGAQWVMVAGQFMGLQSPLPTRSPLFYAQLRLAAGARQLIPAEYDEQALYIVSGELDLGADGVFGAGQLLVIRPRQPLSVQAGMSGAIVMLLGGEPMAGPRHLVWNFVSSREERIEQAKRDWLDQRFDPVPEETEWIPLPDNLKPVDYP